jgi:ubiquinone/menaquinone biosynthesis C-methylase UbiE
MATAVSTSASVVLRTTTSVAPSGESRPESRIASTSLGARPWARNVGISSTSRDGQVRTAAEEYLRTLAALYPRLYALLDLDRARAAETLNAVAAVSNEFDSDRTGRGDSYRRAQRDALVRWTGMRRLLTEATPAAATGDVTLLDVLGGDGTVARAVQLRCEELAVKVDVYTGDISGEMVERALAQGLPAVRQSADRLLLRDGSVDAALLAYGTHHIAPADLPAAVAEAVRVVRPGGRVVVHDFDRSSPMAGFFARLVHPHSAAGHDYPHPTREQLAALFRPLGVPVRVLESPRPAASTSPRYPGWRSLRSPCSATPTCPSPGSRTGG